MLRSPSHSGPDPVFPLLGAAMGLYLAFVGVRVVIRRETKIGPKGGPYNTVYGKEAISVGIGFILFGLFFVVFGILAFLRYFNWI
jgi:tellurite resistance protein TehA-like permease